MTNPGKELERILDELSAIDRDIQKLAQNAAVAEATFKAEFAKSRLSHRYSEWKSKPTEAMIEDLATVDTEDARKAHLVASALLDARRSSLRALTAQLDGLRTLMASQRGI